jgi:hypothetical protein
MRPGAPVIRQAKTDVWWASWIKERKSFQKVLQIYLSELFQKIGVRSV